MKQILIKLAVAFIFLIFSNQISSQNLKKAFKAFYEDQNYAYAENIFKSSEYRMTCIGLYGQALIQHKKPYVYDANLSSEKNLKNEIQEKKSAYSKIKNSEELISSLDEKDIKSLNDYFSTQKIYDLKKEIETYFLDLDPSVYDKPFLSDMERLSKRDGFFIALENKFINLKFEEIKKIQIQHNKITATERLIENFPKYSNTDKLQRFIDSLRFSDAKTISSMSVMINKYPENQFKPEILNKIKQISSEFTKGIKEKNKDYQKIVVIAETDAEDEAIKMLIDKYYSLYLKLKYTIDDQYYYMELSEENLKKYSLQKKYILYSYCKLKDYNSLENEVYRSNNFENGSFGLDLNNGLQIHPGRKVYKNGKELTDYSAIAVMLCGKWRFEYDEVTQSMNEIIKELKEKTKHQVITYGSVGPIKIYPDDNPFPFDFDLTEIEGFSFTENSISVVFISSYKKPYLFEIDPTKIDEALERIMYKVGFYFKD